MVLSSYRAMILFSHVMMIIPQNDAFMSCKNTNASIVAIHLSCSSNQWIHVRNETYGNTTLEQGCLDTTNSCTRTLSTDDDRLVVNCNGKQTCYEVVQASTNCTPVRSYKIIYDCVEESLDVCSSKNKSTNKAVYLHSPGYPSSDGVNDNCTCRISGPQMLVQLIEHPGRKKDLNISTDGENLGQGVLPPVNRIIVQRANHTTLNYQGLEDGRFWIKVTGSGMIDVRCSNESIKLLSTSMATTTPDITKESSSTDTTSSDTASSDTTTISNTSESSDTVTDDNNHTTTDPNVTKTTDLATNDADGPLSIVALASIGAAGVFVVLVLIIVGVICCSRMRKSEARMGHKNTDPVELGYITVRPGQSGETSLIADHKYFQLDHDFVSQDRKKADEEASISREECHSMPQYAIVSRSSRVPAYDNNTLNDGDQSMVTNAIYISRPPHNEQPEEGMVDNFRYQTFKHSEAMNQSESPVKEDDIGDRDEGMVISDLNHSDQTPFVDQHLSASIAQQSDEINHRRNSDGEGTTDIGTGGGMMVNDLYHSYQASPGDIPALSAQTEQPDNNDEQDDTAGMVLNDLYHSYQSPEKSQNPNKDQEPKGGGEVSDNNNLMTENDLHYSEIKQNQDEVTQRKSGGHYEEIVNNEHADPGDLRGQGPKLRPPAYEDIADITSVS